MLFSLHNYIFMPMPNNNIYRIVILSDKWERLSFRWFMLPNLTHNNVYAFIDSQTSIIPTVRWLQFNRWVNTLTKPVYWPKSTYTGHESVSLFYCHDYPFLDYCYFIGPSNESSSTFGGYSYLIYTLVGPKIPTTLRANKCMTIQMMLIIVGLKN